MSAAEAGSAGRYAIDTNVLVRAVVRDDERQAALAEKTLREAVTLAVSLVSLCELVWVLRRVYEVTPNEACAAVRALIDVEKVAVDRVGAEAGLAMLEAGGDFADAVIAHDGRRLGGDTFVSFDRRAVSLLRARGESAVLLRDGSDT